jgi:hypothetical protein
MFEHLGGAGAGAAAGLDMVLMQQLRDQQMKEQIRQAQAREALAARELTQRELEHQSSVADRGREAERQAAKDAAAADATGRQERTLGNIAGVVDMSAEGLDPETATREVVSTSLRGGMEPPRSVVDLFKREPPKRHPMTVRGANGQPVRRLVDESELEAGVDEYREPKEPRAPAGPQDQTWVIRNGQPVPIAKGTAQPGDRPYDAVAERGASPVNNSEALDTAREAKRIAGTLRQHQGLGGAFGVMDSRLPTFRQTTADAEVLRDALTSLLTLENTGKLKGVLSNADMKILQQASTTLAGKMSDSAARAELLRLEQVMGRAEQALGGEAPAPAMTEPRMGRTGAATPTGGGAQYRFNPATGKVEPVK